MPDLRELLDQAVAPDEAPPPVEAIIGRGRRRRTTRRAGTAVVGVLVLVVAAVVLVDVARPQALPVIGERPSASASPEPTQPATTAPSSISPAPPDTGDELADEDLANLPDAGVAIGVGSGPASMVVFVGLDGDLIGHLPAALLSMPSYHGSQGGGPTRGPLLLALEGGALEGYVEIGAGDVEELGLPDVEAGTSPEQWPMAHGYVLDRPVLGAPAGFRLVAPDGGTVFELSAGGPWSVGAGREVVSRSDGPAGDGAPAVAYDLVAGTRVEVPGSCLAHDRTVQGIVLVCFDPEAPFADRDWATVRLLHDDGTTEQLLGPFVWPGQDFVIGHYRSASVSPDGRWIGVQHSGGCESPTAMVAEVGQAAEPSPFVEADGYGVESTFVGWTADSRAVVALSEGICGTGHDVPGLYLVDPAGGSPQLLWESAPGQGYSMQLWGPME